MANEKRNKFKRLAENRTNKIIDMVRLIGNLSNKSHYEYTEEEVDLIFETIQEELEFQKQKFVTANLKKFRL